MYRLEEKGPRTLVLREATEGDPAVTIEVLPASRGLKRRAGAAARARFPGLPDNLDEADTLTMGDFVDAATRETLRLAITGWSGIGDAKGKPVAITPPLDVRTATAADAERPTGTIDLFLADDELVEAADRLFLVPAAVRDREKNVARRSSIGTPKAGQVTARGAQPRGDAKSAHTSATPSKRSPRKKPS